MATITNRIERTKNNALVLFSIEQETRRVRIAGCTTNPNVTWVTQEARQLVWELKNDDQEMVCLIHDNDTKFTSSFVMYFAQKELMSFTHLSTLPW